jgi:hypothetical protein
MKYDNRILFEEILALVGIFAIVIVVAFIVI